jgi:5-methylcytosine-specific restriction endonuclease McrA
VTKHGLGRKDGHRRLAEQTLREEKACWICGLPALPDDPLVADHVIARADGGTNVRENYRVAHPSCNGRRGSGAPKPRPPRARPRFSRSTLQ